MEEVKAPENTIESPEQKNLAADKKVDDNEVAKLQETKNTPDNINDIDVEESDEPVNNKKSDVQERAGLSEEQKSDLKAETGWSDNVTENINSLEEANVYKEVGLQEAEVDGKDSLVRDIDSDFTDDDSDIADDDVISNKDLMERGLSPIDSSGEKIELHHIGQHQDSPLAELTTSEHRRGGNDTILHDKKKETEVHGEGNNWGTEREKYWKARAKDFE